MSSWLRHAAALNSLNQFECGKKTPNNFLFTSDALNPLSFLHNDGYLWSHWCSREAALICGRHKSLINAVNFLKWKGFRWFTLNASYVSELRTQVNFLAPCQGPPSRCEIWGVLGVWDTFTDRLDPLKALTAHFWGVSRKSFQKRIFLL